MSNFEKKKTPFFSVVIPTYERPEDLRQCLQSLSPDNQSGVPSYEIIVTDDSRSDQCRKVVEQEFPYASWGLGKQTGPAGNRNAGVSRATGKWIVFIDDDCIAQPGYLTAYAQTIENASELGVIEGRIFPDRPRRTWAEGCPANEKGGMFWTSNLCVKRSVFLELGGLDEQFRVAYEDVDFAHRLKKTGIQTTFAGEAATCHPWRSVRQGGNNWKARDYEAADFVRFLKKHKPTEIEFSFWGYARNLARIMTRDLFTCARSYHFRGIDILFFQAMITLKGMILILRYNTPARK
jgi:GT2 family glycosyltransferase